MYKLICTVPQADSITYLDIDLSEQEYNAMLRFLRWMRETSYGSFHAELNLYTQKAHGTEQEVKVIDIAPTQKQRIKLDATISL